MTTRRNYLRGLMAAGCIGSVGQMANRGSGKSDSFSAFIERRGTELIIDGEPFYFSGANAPYLTHTYPSREAVDEVLSFASDMDLDVIRTWLTSVGDPPDEWAKYHQPSPGELGEKAFEHADYVIQQAEQHDIRLIFALLDNWDHYGGIDAYVEWSDTANEHDDFYLDDNCRTWYKQYVEQVLTRENTLTGRVYRDDPTIMMWELGNELAAKSAGVDVLQAWKEEMTSHIKHIDDNHLLTTGSSGEYNRDDDRWYYGGEHGIDFIQNHQISHIDVCSFHLYPEWMWEDSKEAGLEWIEDHLIDARDVLKKPAFLGEFGWAIDRDPPRTEVYQEWYNLIDEFDGSGAAPWALVKEDADVKGKYDIRPSHTEIASVLMDFSVTQQAKRETKPVINRFDIRDRSNPAWARYCVDWAVSDADGDLRTVVIELLDTSGSVVDRATVAVDGDSASGNDNLRSKTASSELRLAISDAAGNSTVDVVDLK